MLLETVQNLGGLTLACGTKDGPIARPRRGLRRLAGAHPVHPQVLDGLIPDPANWFGATARLPLGTAAAAALISRILYHCAW